MTTNAIKLALDALAVKRAAAERARIVGVAFATYCAGETAALRLARFNSSRS